MKSEKRKRSKIKKLVKDLLIQSHKEALRKIDYALYSGAISLDDWDEDDTPLILPKSITVAILEEEAGQYRATGTSYEKKMNKEIKNIRRFL
ncbi:MAG: hypothetical protein ACI8Q1_000238 [Parvicella sp.]|jgi:hypothetical protein